MAQEILIGIERRRRWSDERKLAILAEVGVDGASGEFEKPSGFEGAFVIPFPPS